MTIDAPLIVAITGAVTGIGALVLNRLSQKETSEQAEAAQKVASQGQRLEETQQALESLGKALASSEHREERSRARVEELEKSLDEERELRRHLFAAQESRCREVTAELTETVITLRRVVVDEVAKTAAKVALGRPLHPHDEDSPRSPWAETE